MTNNHYILINLVLSIFTIVFFGLFVHQAITYIKVRHASVVKNDISVEASDFDTNPTNIPSKKRIFATLVTTAVFALLWVSSIIAIYFAHAQSYVETKQLGAVHSVESFFYPSGYLA